MSYGNSNKYQGSAAGNKPSYKPAPTAAKAAAPVKSEGSGKRRPAYDIVAVDGEGQIVKTEEGKSLRLGAIWLNEKGGMFVKFNEDVPAGTTAKTFAVNAE